MRIKKFRAWDIEDKKMIYDPFEFELTRLIIEVKNVSLLKNDRFIGFGEYDASKFIMQQWADLSDRDNTDIFEDDIVITSNSDPKYDIWTPEEHGYALVTIDIYGVHFIAEDNYHWNWDKSNSIYSLKFIKVVGNIHENPNLFKKTTE